MLTGRLPFRASNPAQLVYKIINADPPSVSQPNPDVPEQMDAVIRKALEKDLYSRYRNGAEFARISPRCATRSSTRATCRPTPARFARLRRVAFFTEFEDVDLWEVMRICAWRKVDSEVALMREGDTDQRFGIVLEGRVELSIEGRRVMELGPGEVFGVQAWLDHMEHRHTLRCRGLARAAQATSRSIRLRSRSPARR